MPKIRYDDVATHRVQVRQDILRAAIPLFLARGIAATSMEEIAAAAGVARTTLYNYFRHKEEILLTYVEEQFSRAGAVERSAAAREQDPEAALRRLIELTMAERTAPRHQDYERLFTMLMEEASPAARQTVREHLERLVERVRAAAEQVLERGTAAGVFDARPAGFYTAVLLEMMDAAARSLRAGLLPDRETACALVQERFLRLVRPTA